MKWTDEQRLAMELSGKSLLVAAGAGSGKTAVLVERIVRKITSDDPCDIDNLLVVTFTKAAATEMKERIGLRIAEKLSEDPGNPNLIRQMALLNRANIMTVHAFCKKVISDNFHLAGLDPAFRLMEDNEARMLRSEAMEDVLESSYNDPSEDFLRLTDTLGGKRTDRDLEDITERLYDFAISGPDPERWLKKIADVYEIEGEPSWFSEIYDESERLLDRSIRFSEKTVKLIEEDPVLSDSKYMDFLEKELSYLKNIKDGFDKAITFDEKRDALSGTKLDRLPIVRNVDEGIKEKLKDLRSAYKSYMEKAGEKYSLSYEENIDLIRQMAPVVRALCDLTVRFMKRYGDLKAEKNTADFNDLEHFAMKILCDISYDEDGNMTVKPAETALSYREMFEEILIDEYQDSNDVQEILLNSVSRDGANIFMVGDVKQSIYRFRRAKPELFLSKYRTYSSKDDGSGRKVMLFSNFRSRSEVLDTVNLIFGVLMSEGAGELDYDRGEELMAGAEFPEGERIPAEVMLIETESDETVDEEEELTNKETEARAVALKIKSMVAKGDIMVNVKGKMRPLQYRDIVILLRSTKNSAPVFEKALSDLEVPAYSEAADGYFESTEIRTMMSILRVIDNPRQDIPLLATLRCPIFGFTEEELADIRYEDKDILLIDCIGKRIEKGDGLSDKLRDFLDKTEKWREESIHEELDEFIWDIMTETAYYEYVGAMPDGVKRQANLRMLFQRAGQYEKTAFKGLYHFLRYIDSVVEKTGDFGDAKIFGENEDVVRIMSIHKSKGLEFPVVFVSDLGKKFNRMDQRGDVLINEKAGIGVKFIDVEKGISEETILRSVIKDRINREAMSEEMRILYVALTRAKERIIMTGNVKNIEKSIRSWEKNIPDDGEKMDPEIVLRQGSYLDWVMPAILKAVDGAVRISSLGRKDIISAADSMDDERRAPFYNGEKITDQRILDILNYSYPHERAVELPGKISVSVIKEKAIEEQEIMEGTMRDLPHDVEKLPPEIPVPEFMIDTKELTGAQRGTAFHTAMLHMDLDAKRIEDVDRVIESLVDREILLKSEGDCVSRYKVLEFINSELGQRMKEAEKRGKLYREETFYLRIPASMYDESAPSDEKLTMIGIIDGFFEEGDGIVLMDYKTDSLPDGDIGYLVKRYKTQIDLYRDSIERITEKKVNEAYLYSVNAGRAVRII